MTLGAEKLPRHLSTFSGLLLNLGTSIGAGIFIVQGSMIQVLKAPGLVIIMFFLGGVVSFLGTWAYIDFGLIRPKSGGPKQYLNFAFPKPKCFMAFLFSIVNILAVMPAANAAVSIGAAEYFFASVYGSKGDVIKNGSFYIAENYAYIVRIIAAFLIWIITLIHSFAPRSGIWFQDTLGVTKSLVLVLVCIVAIIAGCGLIPTAPPTGNLTLENLFKDANYDMAAIFNSFFKVMFVFDGWASLNMSLDEFIDPQVNLARAAFGAIIVCTILFLGTTVAYFTVVPVADLMSNDNGIIGLQFFSKTLGPWFGARIVPALIGLAAFSSVMCMIFGASRLIYDCAQDQYFLPTINTLIGQKSRFDTPMAALFLNAFLTMLYIFGPPPGPSYDLLIDMASYPGWIFLGLSVFGLIIISFTRPEVEHRVKAPFIGNILFCFFAICITLMPFVPPKQVKSGGSLLPYWTVPVMGIATIIMASALWYLQVIVFKLAIIEPRFDNDDDPFEGKVCKDIPNKE